MECLTGLVGVDNGCEARVSGVKYINDLPGFELDIADYVTDSEDQTALEVLTTCINNASDELENEVRSFVDPRVRMRSIVEDGIIGFFDDNRQVKSADAGYLGGINLEIPVGNYVAAYLKSVTIFTQNSYVSEDLFIYDLTQGVLLDTIPFSSTAGEYTVIDINKIYKSNGQFLNLFICYDAGTSYKTDIIHGGCGTCGWKKYQMNGWVYARSGKILTTDVKTVNNLVSSTHTYGLSVNYQLVCDSGNFICSIASRLKMAMFYKTGIMLMEEIIQQRTRINSLTTVNVNKARELKKDYTEKYNTSMAHVIGNLAFPNDICFECEPIIKVKPSM